jgi:hypothetical protein
MKEVTRHDYVSRDCKCAGCHGARKARGDKPTHKKNGWYLRPKVGEGYCYMG